MTNIEASGESVDLNLLFENIVNDLELLFNLKSATLRVLDTLPHLRGSPVLLYQLFYNLVNNSLKFSKEEAPLVISVSCNDALGEEIKAHDLDEQREYVKIVLADNGIGFRNEEAQKIFATFVRLHSKDKYEGTGLGLALCKKIVVRHGGAIYAEGAENEGARFTVIFPNFM
jgi:signal transduction histidine kinase